MAFDAQLKKYFPLVVLGLLAIMVYFQASAIGHFVSEALAPDPNQFGKASTPPSTEDLLQAQRSAGARRSADPILERNPFDSVTGPLGLDADAGSPLPAVPAVTDPLSVPACEGVRAQIVTEAEDPRRSIAALQTEGETRTRVYRVGDTVGELTVAYIGYNPRERSPAVWMSKGDVLCQALLFKEAPDVPAPPPVPQAGPEPEAEPAEQTGLMTVGPELRSHIQKSGDGVLVDEAAVDEILSDRTQLMPNEKILPEQWEGKVVGIRIFGIKPDTLLGQLGFQSGDRLESINGVGIQNPAQARDAWGMLKQGELEITVQRRGKPVTFSIGTR